VLKLESHEGKLEATSRATVEAVAKTFGKSQDLTNLLLVIADVLDYAADGHNSYITIGTNRDKSAFLLSIKQDGHGAYVSATSIAELSAACSSVL